MKNTSSSGMTCMRRSRAAGKSVPPSFCQAIWGLGWPVAAHSRRAIVPVRMAMSWGILVNDGNTAKYIQLGSRYGKAKCKGQENPLAGRSPTLCLGISLPPHCPSASACLEPLLPPVNEQQVSKAAQLLPARSISISLSCTPEAGYNPLKCKAFNETFPLLFLIW